jgi:hypothetical protein
MNSAHSSVIFMARSEKWQNARTGNTMFISGSVCLQVTSLKSPEIFFCLTVCREVFEVFSTAFGCGYSRARVRPFAHLHEDLHAFRLMCTPNLAKTVLERKHFFNKSWQREVKYVNFALLGYYATSNGNPFPTFRDNVSITSSGGLRRWFRCVVPSRR